MGGGCVARNGCPVGQDFKPSRLTPSHKWATEQGITLFMVSWKSADESMAEVTWDDYIRAQIGAIDHVRERLGVPSVHAIGYCVAGTTLAATLAMLSARGEADKVKSVTFLVPSITLVAAFT